MKKLLFLLACIISASGLFAQHVTEEQALQKAQAFMQGKVINNANGRKGVPTKPRAMKRVAQSKQEQGEDVLYMFNVEDNGGYVIVSGDERTEAILGYSTEGNIDPQRMPENMRAWLKGYEQQIKAIPTYAKENICKVPTHAAIAPMLTTLWGQNPPYNLMCPEIDGKHSMTGCIATAIAQIMNYHKWPEGSTKAIPSYSDYEKLSSTTFDWNLMKRTYGVSSSGPYADEVAKLMRYCGQAFLMEYGLEESSTTLLLYHSLTDYFGYSDKVRYVIHDLFTVEEWDELIYHEMESKRPVILGVVDYFTGGHAIVCDGYDGDGFYHMNYGWNGNSNGYYRLAQQPSDYNKEGAFYYFGIHALIGIQRPDENAEDPMGGNLIEAATNRYPLDAITVLFHNVGGVDENFDFGMRYYCEDENSDEVITHTIVSNYFLPTDSILTVSNIKPSGLPKGHFLAVPVWKRTSETLWTEDKSIPISFYFNNYGMISTYRPDINISASEIEFLGYEYGYNNGYRLKFDLYNYGADFRQDIYISYYDSMNNRLETHLKNSIVLGEGEGTTIYSSFEPEEEGDYRVVVTTVDGDVLTEGFVTLSEFANLKYQSGNVKYNFSTKTATVEITNNSTNPYTREIKVLFFGDNTERTCSSGIVNIPPGETKNIEIDCSDVDIHTTDYIKVMHCYCLSNNKEIYNPSIESWHSLIYDGWGVSRLYREENNCYIGYTSYDISKHIAEITRVEIRKGFETVIMPSKTIDDYGTEYSVNTLGIGWLFVKNEANKEIKNLILSEGFTDVRGQTPIRDFEMLKSITLPASLERICFDAIGNCPSLEAIYCKSHIPPTIVSDDYGNIEHRGIIRETLCEEDGITLFDAYPDYENITLYVPMGSSGAYSKTWSSFVNIKEMNVEDMFSTATTNQFKIGYTTYIDVSAEAWHADAMVGWAAPMVTTRDGRETALVERYAETTEVTGTVLEQTVTGLPVGAYEVTLFANAFYTPERGFDSDITEGQMDVVYLFANDTKQYIPVHIGTTVSEHGEYTLSCNVSDGTLHLGMTAEREGTNWHSIQIKSLDRTGDVNGDGNVDVSDYIGVANHILGQTQEGFNEDAADVNGDGVIDVSDYIGIANIILTSSPYGN